MSSYVPAPTPTTYGHPPANNQNQGNGFAVAALVLGIIPTGVIGIIFGILGLVVWLLLNIAFGIVATRWAVGGKGLATP